MQIISEIHYKIQGCTLSVRSNESFFPKRANVNTLPQLAVRFPTFLYRVVEPDISSAAEYVGALTIANNEGGIQQRKRNKCNLL